MKNIKNIIYTWFLLSCVVILIDFLSIKVFNNSSLVFDLHCYSYGITFFISSFLFYQNFSKMFKHKNMTFVFILSCITGFFWWLMTYLLLMGGVHSFLGGTY